MAARYGAQQTLSLPGEPCVTSTDETLLSIVIHNLLTNAIKYSRKGQGHVWLALKADGSEWEITVRDDGIGIPEEEQARLFEKFFRASNARTIDTDGNGLGLHIAQAMVSRLGGRMTFESRSGKGTTFIVRLPRQRLAQVA
jgi:two-component system sensor histidine kinase SenX3